MATGGAWLDAASIFASANLARAGRAGHPSPARRRRRRGRRRPASGRALRAQAATTAAATFSMSCAFVISRFQRNLSIGIDFFGCTISIPLAAARPSRCRRKKSPHVMEILSSTGPLIRVAVSSMRAPKMRCRSEQRIRSKRPLAWSSAKSRCPGLRPGGRLGTNNGYIYSPSSATVSTLLAERKYRPLNISACTRHRIVACRAYGGPRRSA